MTKTSKNAYMQHSTYNGAPIPEGHVLVPVWFLAALKNEMDNTIDENFITWTFCGVSFLIGFTPIAEECFDSYMQFFWSKINEQIAKYRPGRCVIGKKKDGSPKTCPKTRLCTDCPHSRTLPRYNPKKEEEHFFSLDTYKSDKRKEKIDTRQLDPADEAMLADTFLDLIEHLRSIKPRYAEIALMGLSGLEVDEISERLHLKSSRGHQEYATALQLTLDYWHLRKS